MIFLVHLLKFPSRHTASWGRLLKVSSKSYRLGPIGDLRTLSWDQYKNWQLNIEITCCKELKAIFLVLRSCSCFSQEEKMFKSSKWNVHGIVFWAKYGMSLGPNKINILETSMDASQTSSLNSTPSHIKLRLIKTF